MCIHDEQELTKCYFNGNKNIKRDWLINFSGVAIEPNNKISSQLGEIRDVFEGEQLIGRYHLARIMTNYYLVIFIYNYTYLYNKITV